MPCRIYKLDFQEKNLNLDQDWNQGSPVLCLALLTIELSKFPCSNVPLEMIDRLKIKFVNSTRHEIYRLNLNYSQISSINN